jgi:hypothetical protein
MDITVHRFGSGENQTIGALHINGEFECFTLEDEYREIKVKGETRIPAGIYKLDFRKADSPLTLKYRKKYDFFNYHLEVQNVPNFNYIYIHIGNYESQTDGCLLLGDTATKTTLGSSKIAFTRVYKKISAALEAGELVKIEYIDYNRPK